MSGESLRAVAYVSSATELLADVQLEELLTQARALNEHNAITGVLLYNDGDFMQYFEGPGAAVRETLERIRASRRHTGIIVLFDMPIDQRMFPDWQMGFARPTRSELLAVSTAKWQEAAAEAAWSAATPPGLNVLVDFWMRARR